MNIWLIFNTIFITWWLDIQSMTDSPEFFFVYVFLMRGAFPTKRGVTVHV
jgi:hypothetical protein